MPLQWIVYIHIGILVLLLISLRSVNSQAQQSSNSSDSAQDDDMGESALSKGMDPLYKMTNVFLGDVLQPHRISNYFNISQIRDRDYWSLDDWKKYADYAVGFLVCLVIGVLFIIILPIVGLFFCCCRCCGRCGGKAGPHDHKSAKCKRLSYGCVLTILNTLVLTSVVCLFCTNELLHQQFQNEDNKGAFGKIEDSLQHIQDYVDNAYQNLKSGTLGQYETKIWSPDRNDLTKSQLIRDINDTAKEAVDQLAREVNATPALEKAQDLAKEVNSTLESLTAIGTSLHNLTILGNKLNTELSQSRTDILHELTKSECIQEICDGPKAIVESLKVKANFTELSRLESITTTVGQQVDIFTYVQQAENVLDSIKSSAESKIQTEINKANDIAKDTWGEITRALDQAHNIINQIHIKTNVKNSLHDAAKYTKDYGQYWWYAGIGISCVALLVVVFFYFGLLYGLCGERAGDDAQCCNRGLGANLLMAGVGFCFIFGWLLMIVTVILFLPGGLTYTEGCRYFNTHDPEELKMFDPLLDLVEITGVYKSEANITLSQILRDCKEDRGIYQALQLQHVIDLPKYFNPEGIEGALNDIKGINLALGNLTISDQLTQQIRDFGAAGFENISIAQYREQINKNLTSVDLNDVAKELEGVGNTLVEKARLSSGPRTAQQAINESLSREAEKLRTIATTTVMEMKNEVAILKAAVDQLEVKKDLKKETEELVDAIILAQDNFNTYGKTLVQEALIKEVEKIKTTINKFTGEVLSQVQTNVAKCKPVYDAIYSASDAACQDILNPLNGFWFSLGWCLFFFIPSIIFAVKLAGLYRKEDEYVPGVRSRDFEDPNMEIYSHIENHNDTIPLTSIDKAGRPVTNGGMPNSGYRQDDYSKLPQYLDNQRNYAGGDGCYPEARGHPGGGYPGDHDRHGGYDGYPNGHANTNGSNRRGRDNFWDNRSTAVVSDRSGSLYDTPRHNPDTVSEGPNWYFPNLRQDFTSQSPHHRY